MNSGGRAVVAKKKAKKSGVAGSRAKTTQVEKTKPRKTAAKKTAAKKTAAKKTKANRTKAGRSEGNKTQFTGASVKTFLARLADAERRDDAETVLQMMRRVTTCRPRMWGHSIVGFGSYHYVYDTGHEGDAPIVGLAPRGRELVLYVLTDFARRDALLAQLGKHRTGVSCLYIRRLADVDIEVLEELVAASVADRKERYAITLE
jgi:hypothetical protein